MSAQRIARISILSALAVSLRFAFGAFPNVKPITALFLVLMGTLGWVDSLLVMAVTMLVTGIYMGFGVIVLWQIVSFAVAMLVWGLLVSPFFQMGTKTSSLRQTSYSQMALPVCLQAVAAGGACLLYGWVIALLSSWQFQLSVVPYWLNGLIFDAAHALSTFLFYPIIYFLSRRWIR